MSFFEGNFDLLSFRKVMLHGFLIHFSTASEAFPFILCFDAFDHWMGLLEFSELRKTQSYRKEDRVTKDVATESEVGKNQEQLTYFTQMPA